MIKLGETGGWLERFRGVQLGIGGSSRRRAASEGSLLLTVAGSLNAYRIRRGGKGRGEHESAGKGGGGGSGHYSKRDS